MPNQLTRSNRPENVKLLQEFLRKWGRQRGLAKGRIKGLEKAASDIFRFIITRVYPPGLPGSLAITLEEKGTRLRLVFEDNGPPFDAATLDALSSNASPSTSGLDLSRLKEWSESMIYYRTPDQKNRLVTFFTL
jgi:anti-sigma regulatory factor (Ser/Thr protein kinase)